MNCAQVPGSIVLTAQVGLFTGGSETEPRAVRRGSAKYCCVTAPVLVTFTVTAVVRLAERDTLLLCGIPLETIRAPLNPMRAVNGRLVWLPDEKKLSSSTNCQRPGCGLFLNNCNAPTGVPNGSIFGCTLTSIPFGSTSTPSRMYPGSAMSSVRLMFDTLVGTSNAKVCVGPAPLRPLPPVSEPVKLAPFAVVAMSVRRLTGICGIVAPPAGCSRMAAPRSPGCEGMKNCAVMFWLWPGARVSFAGDTVPIGA